MTIRPYPISLLLALLFTFSALESHGELRSMRWGVDDAGTKGRLFSHPKGKQIMEEFGFNFLVTHYFPRPSTAKNRNTIHTMDSWCQNVGIEWVANLETANFRKKFIDTDGRDWFNRPDGRHFWLFPDELLRELGQCKQLAGLMYDEAAHMQNCRNKIAGLDTPWIFDPKGHSLENGAEGFTQAAIEIRNIHAKHGIKLYTEHVLPVLYHSFARAGWTAGTKILKENWSPAYIACALGAAKQYGTELWITPDLWMDQVYPGHSPDEYRSALLLAYHMGADCIYTENLAFDNKKNLRGSLIQMTPDDYELTPYGKITKWFGKTYMPQNPRVYSFSDIKPRVAIIRQPDATWGQSDSWLPDSLFGHKLWKSNNKTEAWLKIWHLLSAEVISKHSLSWHNRKLSRAQAYQVFAPLDGVVVYDHHVEARHLEGIEVFFLTGLGISNATQTAVEKYVKKGATCIAMPHLLPDRISSLIGNNVELTDGRGRWVVTTDFLSDHVRKSAQHVIPKKDIIRYRFGEHTVIFEPVDGDMNRLKVTTTKENQHHP